MPPGQIPGGAGDIITAVAMTGAGTGSGPSTIRITAVRDGDQHIINGQKTFLSNRINGDLVVPAVKVDTKAGPPADGVRLIRAEYITAG